MRVCSFSVKHWAFHEFVESDHTFGIENIGIKMSLRKKIRSRGEEGTSGGMTGRRVLVSTLDSRVQGYI